MGFGWAPTDLLMGDDTITADRIQTLNQHEQFDFIKLYNQTNQSDFIEDSPFTGKQTSCNYYTPDEFAKTFHQTSKSLSLLCIYSFIIIWRPSRVADTPPLIPISRYGYCLFVADVCLCSEVLQPGSSWSSSGSGSM